MLRGDPRPTRPKTSASKKIEDLSHIRVWTHKDVPKDELELAAPEPSAHEQEDGTIFACCATGTSSKDSLLSWIRLLERQAPMLNHMQIVFTIKQMWSPIKPLRVEELAMKPFNK